MYESLARPLAYDVSSLSNPESELAYPLGGVTAAVLDLRPISQSIWDNGVQPLTV